MNTFSKSLVVGAALAASTLATGTVLAETSANVAVTSNYVWRGLTQTDDKAALQAGLDWSDKNGLYAGAWASNVDFGTDATAEIDTYFGYSGEVNEFGYDIGYLAYNYHGEPVIDFAEFYVGGSYKMVSLTYYKNDDYDYSYTDVAADFDVSGFGIGLHYGTWGGDFEGNDYSVALSKGFSGFDASLTYTSASKDVTGTGDSESETFLTISKGFDL